MIKFQSSCLMEPPTNKSELPPPLLPNRPQHELHLPLHSNDHNNIAFTSESSSLSSSSTPLLYDHGETSPDSMRSLSSLSSARTDSPLDVDMPEAEMGKVMGNSDDSGIQSPDCRPDYGEDNDNSVSVYLDANEDCWSDNDNHNVTLVLSQKVSQNDGDGTSLCSSENGEDDDDNKDDEEEDSFLSLASVEVIIKSQVEVSTSSEVVKPNTGLQDISESHIADVSKVCLLNETNEKGEVSVELPLAIQDTDIMNETFVSPENSEVDKVSCTITCTRSISKADNQPNSNEQPADLSKMAVMSEPNREVVHEKGEDSAESHLAVMFSENSETNLITGSKDVTSHLSISKDDNHPKVNGQPPEVDKITNHTEPNKEVVHEEGEVSIESIQETDVINETMVSLEKSEANKDSTFLTGTKNTTSSPSKDDQTADVSTMATVIEPNKEVCTESIQEPDVINETMVSPENIEANKMSAPKTGTKNVASSREDNKPKPTAKKTNNIGQTRAPKPEMKRFPRPDLRNVKAKIISRAASASRSANPAKTNTGVSLSGSVKVPAGRKVEDKTVGKRSRSSSNHTRGNEAKTCISAEVVLSGGQENDVNTLSLPTQGEKTMVKLDCASSTDCKGEEEPQLEKEAGEETCKSPNKTVSSKLEPSLGTNSTSSSGSPDSRLKPLNRPTGSLSPAGGRVLQPAGIPRMRSTEKPTIPSSPTSVSSSSCKAPQRTTSSKLPVKGLPTSPSSSSLGSTISESNSTAVNKVPVEVLKSEEKSVKQSPTSQIQGKSVVSKPVLGHRSRASSTPTKPASVGLKAPALTNHVTAKNNQNVLHRSGSTRLTRSSSVVDKGSKGSKSAGPTSGRTPQQSPAGQAGPVEEEEEKEDLRLQNEKKSQCILHLRKLIANGNRRLEALALVVQHIFSEREAAIKQREELSVQINNLRGQLSNSVSCCEQLEREKEEVRVTLEALFQKLQDQHQTELQQLEERLKDFYSAEWDKTHEAYQREADKCRALMQQQVEDVRIKQEALRKQQEVAHTEQIATLKHEHETSLTELRKAHENDMQELDKTLKESKEILNEKIETLTAENETLKERLRMEEERRRALADKSQKDAHTLYLEQELESLRAVLEIKTNQIHQKDKKLMQMDKLTDDNLKLEECLKKVQQENEDYKARMDKHAALSKQLSTEQAMLQQNLQKESKVNKRLSMENEELLWKLHNGDLCSPRRLSPSSPFPSPQNSASFSSAPISPR